MVTVVNLLIASWVASPAVLVLGIGAALIDRRHRS